MLNARHSPRTTGGEGNEMKGLATYKGGHGALLGKESPPKKVTLLPG